MAQTGYTPISIYYSSTAGNTPTAGNLVAGELAINTADGKLFYKDSAGVVQVIAGKGGAGVAGGSNTQVQYNSSGSLAGSANFTFNGTTVTIANDASISGLTVGKGGGTATNSTAVGLQALYNASSTGTENSAFGRQALYSLTSGGSDVAIGNYALYLNTTGNYNTALGYSALQNNTTASYNTAVGYQSLYNSTGGNNTALGFYSGFTITTGSNNLNLGYNSGAAITTGTDNITIGFQAANWSTGITTGSGNIFIGTKSQPNANTDSGELVISTGTGAVTGKGTNTGYLYVNGSIYQGNNSTLWSITSDQRLKKNIVDNNVGLEKITQIKVRNFEYRLPNEVTELDQSNAINIKGVQLGAIAQELKEVLPDCVKTESTGVMSVDASNLTWYLVNAIKELKAEIDQLKGK